MPYPQDRVSALLSGSGQNAGLTIDTSGRPTGQEYYFYIVGLEVGTPFIIDIQNWFGGDKGSVVDIINIHPENNIFTLEYSRDGENYGLPIYVYNTFGISDFAWQAISKIRLTALSDSTTAWIKVI